MSRRPSNWGRRRATAAAPARSGAKSSTTQIIALVIIVLVALSGAYYYFDVYHKSSSTGYFSERIRIDIGGAFINATDPSQDTPATYYPNSFNVSLGAHITLAITNTDNMTHGLAVPQFNVDTGPVQPNATAMLTFVASPNGNYTFSEPSADCGGGNCDAGQAMNGWFVVQG